MENYTREKWVCNINMGTLQCFVVLLAASYTRNIIFIVIHFVQDEKSLWGQRWGAEGRGGGLIHLSTLVFRLIIYLVLLQFPQFGVNCGFSVKHKMIIHKSD